METLLGTKFAVRKILLLMISGIFLVGCAYQTSAVPIDFGIESRTDLNGDGKEDRVRVIDRRDAGFYNDHSECKWRRCGNKRL